MPTYVYACRRCKLRFERVQKFSEEPVTKCIDPDCGGEVYREIQPISFFFKGEGFGREKQSDGSSIWSR